MGELLRGEREDVDGCEDGCGGEDVEAAFLGGDLGPEGARG